jgi:hypothetical protein
MPAMCGRGSAAAVRGPARRAADRTPGGGDRGEQPEVDIAGEQQQDAKCPGRPARSADAKDRRVRLDPKTARGRRFPVRAACLRASHDHRSAERRSCRFARLDRPFPASGLIPCLRIGQCVLRDRDGDAERLGDRPGGLEDARCSDDRSDGDEDILNILEPHARLHRRTVAAGTLLARCAGGLEVIPDG